jgi:hypothetical protein
MPDSDIVADVDIVREVSFHRSSAVNDSSILDVTSESNSDFVLVT